MYMFNQTVSANWLLRKEIKDIENVVELSLFSHVTNLFEIQQISIRSLGYAASLQLVFINLIWLLNTKLLFGVFSSPFWFFSYKLMD